MKNKKHNKILSTFNFGLSTCPQGGFTLVELMVSLSLFIIVVLALVGSLYNVNDASRKVQAMRTVMDNLNFAMESMSRTIRTGEDISCDIDVPGVNCPIGGAEVNRELTVKSTLGESAQIDYRWVRDATNKGRIEKKRTDLTNPGGDTPEWVAITSPEIDVEKFSFYVSGVGANDSQQPSVIIKLEGVATASTGTIAPFAIQTYLSQRAPE